MTTLAELKEIYIYPIKSLPGIKINRAIVTQTGIVHADNRKIADRKWMIVDENGSFKTLRNVPKMALINVSIKGDFFVLQKTGKTDLHVPITPKELISKKCRIWDLYIYGYSYGGEVSKWLSDALEIENLDLVVFSDEFETRRVKDINEPGCEPREDDCVIYGDSAPFMLANEASLADLNSRETSKQFSMRSFRPNFVVAGCEPFAEDEWKRIKIGPVNFLYINMCVRCNLTTVDPDKGEKNVDQEPLTTLRKYRLKKEVYENSPMFGVYFVWENNNNNQELIQIGDKITMD